MRKIIPLKKIITGYIAKGDQFEWKNQAMEIMNPKPKDAIFIRVWRRKKDCTCDTFSYKTAKFISQKVRLIVEYL